MEDDQYNAYDNSSRCYALALKEIRLQGIRDGKFQPRDDDKEEIAEARKAGFIPDPK